MRPPNLNTDTLDALYNTGVEDLPAKERWLDVHPNEINDRYVVIGEEALGDDLISRGFGGCWPDLRDALQSYDWNAGAPVYIVDLWHPPDQAVIRVILNPTTADRWSSFDDAGIA